MGLSWVGIRCRLRTSYNCKKYSFNSEITDNYIYRESKKVTKAIELNYKTDDEVRLTIEYQLDQSNRAVLVLMLEK